MGERLSRTKYFADFVSPETAERALFGYAEASSIGFIKGGNQCQIYSGFVPSLSDKRIGWGLHVVVGERQDSKGRKNWYFGTFEGPTWMDMATPEEYTKYREMERGILESKNRVSGKRLDGLIRQATADYLKR